MRNLNQTAAVGSNVSLANASVSEDQGPNFCNRNAHVSVQAALKSIAETHPRGAEMKAIISERSVGGQAREEKILRALELIGEEPESVKKLLDAARRDVKAGRNGDQMLRYVVNTTYQENADGDMFYSHKTVQRAIARVINDGATTPETEQKFLGLLESSLSPKGLEIALTKKFSSAALFEVITANADKANEQIGAYLASPTKDPVAAAMVEYHRDPSNPAKAEALAQAIPLQPKAVTRLNKAFGLPEDAAPIEAIKKLIAFSPSHDNPEDIKQSVAVLQGALHAMRHDPQFGQALYEIAVTKLYNPDKGDDAQVWKNSDVQKQFAKSLVALARIGNRTKDMTPFVKTMTWYEGTLTAAQVGALLKQDSLDPTVVHEMLISSNIKPERTHKDRNTGEIRYPHKDKLNEFLARVDTLGANATENQKTSAEIIRRALDA